MSIQMDVHLHLLQLVAPPFVLVPNTSDSVQPRDAFDAGHQAAFAQTVQLFEPAVQKIGT